MSPTLRDYQVAATGKGVHSLRRGDGRSLLVEPTGSGKSLVIAATVAELDKPAVVFQPTKELLAQNAEKMIAYGFNPSVFSASFGSRDVGNITLATIGTAKGRSEMFSDVHYVIIDEAHNVDPSGGMYSDFIGSLRPDVRILGLTATPYRLHSDGYGGSQLKFLTRTRPAVFTDVAHFSQICDLINRGYLVRPTYHSVTGFDRGKLVYNTTGSNFTDESMRRQFKRLGFKDRLVRVVKRLLDVGRKHVLVFTTFVDDANELAAAVPGVSVVSGESPDRDAAISAFRAGAVPVVANVGVLHTGFDFPELDTVVLARPTVSLGLYYQMVGRLMRPAKGKSDAWVVDMVDQLGEFGKVDDLWIRPGGARGKCWEIVNSNSGKVLTNRYFGEAKKFWKNRSSARAGSRG